MGVYTTSEMGQYAESNNPHGNVKYYKALLFPEFENEQTKENSSNNWHKWT